MMATHAGLVGDQHRRFDISRFQIAIRHRNELFHNLTPQSRIRTGCSSIEQRLHARKLTRKWRAHDVRASVSYRIGYHRRKLLEAPDERPLARPATRRRS